MYINFECTLPLPTPLCLITMLRIYSVLVDTITNNVSVPVTPILFFFYVWIYFWWYVMVVFVQPLHLENSRARVLCQHRFIYHGYAAGVSVTRDIYAILCSWFAVRLCFAFRTRPKNMMTKHNGNPFRVTDPLWGNPSVIPLAKGRHWRKIWIILQTVLYTKVSACAVITKCVFTMTSSKWKFFSALLALYAGNSRLTSKFPTQRASNADFDVSLMWVRNSC